MWNIKDGKFQKNYIYSKKENSRYEYPQAMIASSDKPGAIDTAKRWASGKYCNYVEDDYVEYVIDNKNIKLEILDRVSCWCCANKNLKELKQYYLYLPTYWNKLKEFQRRTNRPMKYNKYTVFDLEENFEKFYKNT